jgi:hypothetical protein
MAAAKEMRRALIKRVLNKLVQRPAILPLSQRNNIERSPEAVYDMNGRSQMQRGKNWILSKDINANRFF